MGVLEVVGVLLVGVEVVLGGGVLVVGGGVVLVVVGVGVQLMPTRVAPAGSEGAAPGGKSRLSVWVAPPSSLTVTTQGLADEADGMAAMPTTASAEIAPTTSFRLRNTVVNLLPPVCSSKSLTPRPQAARRGRYCLTPWFATENRRPRATIRGAPNVLDLMAGAGRLVEAGRASSSRQSQPQARPESYGSRRTAEPLNRGRWGSPATGILWPPRQ